MELIFKCHIELLRGMLMMKEKNNNLGKIFYTPVQKPEEVTLIEVQNNDDLNTINRFVKRIVNRKLKKPNTSQPNFREKLLKEFMSKGLDVNLEEVKTLFELLSNYMYGRAREKEKYWCLIVIEEYLFIYHFTPKSAVSYEGSRIREFIKYLDDTNLLKFIFKLKSEKLSFYFSKLANEEITQIKDKTPHVYGFFDESGTKGMKKLVGEEPEYEFRGELRIRIKRSEKTDIIVETFLDDLENINSNVEFNFQKGVATIKLEDAPIIEFVVDGAKYDISTGLKRIKYEKLGIGRFIESYRFYKNDESIRESKELITLGDKILDKPENNYPKKEETIFVLGETVDDYEKLISEASESIRNNFNVAFVELNGFNANYSEVNIGKFTVFAKLKEDTRINKIEETFREIVSGVSGNLTLEKTTLYVGLLVLCDFLKSKGFREKLYRIGKKVLNDYFINMPKRNIELKEMDKIGIEFKAGVLENNRGFFDPSPKKFAKKLINKFKNKRVDTIIFLVGINEDTRDFSPIQLDRIRNEFHEELREYLSQNGITVLLSETVSINKREGILLLVLQKEIVPMKTL